MRSKFTTIPIKEDIFKEVYDAPTFEAGWTILYENGYLFYIQLIGGFDHVEYEKDSILIFDRGVSRDGRNQWRHYKLIPDRKKNISGLEAAFKSL